MQGFFQLETPDDLLAKLERDFARMNGAMNNPDPAYDFFVTAEHMLDWLHPGKTGEKARKDARQKYPLLQLVSHIATGAKHMVPEAKHHKSVEHVEGPSDAFPHATLAVYPDESTGQALGFTAISTIGLAQKVVDFWRGHARQGWSAV